MLKKIAPAILTLEYSLGFLRKEGKSNMVETLDGAKELQKQKPEKPFINAAFDAIEERRLKGFERAAFKKMGMPYPSTDNDRSLAQKGR